jgi:hypothetical protein
VPAHHPTNGSLTRTASTIALATGVAGTLDILSAIAFGHIAGRATTTTLQLVAAGPLGDGALRGGDGTALLGLAIHFALTAAMVASYVAVTRRTRWLMERPLLAGTGFGVVVYLIMYWIVLPLRWPTAFPATSAWDIGSALFSHIVCMGVPAALVVRMLVSRQHRAAA